MSDAIAGASELTDPDDPGSGRRSALENASTMLASRLLMAAVAWAGTVLIVQSLTEEEWGQFSFVFSLLALVSVLTDLGVGRVALAAVMGDAEDPARAAGNYVILRLALGIMGYAIVAAIVLLGGYPSLVVRATLIGGIVLPVATLISAWTIAFQAAERMAHVAVSNFVAQLGQLALIVAMTIQGGTLLWFVAAAVIRDVVLLPWRWFRATQLMPVTWGFDWDLQKAMLIEAVPLAIGTVLHTVYWRLDSVMLSALATFEDVGVYGIAYKFADLAYAAPLAMANAVLAPLVRAWPNDIPAFRLAFERSGRVLAIIAGFAFVQIMLFAEPLIRTLFGEVYVEGVAATQILVLSELGAFLALLAFTTLVAAGRHVVYAIVTLAGLVLNVGLNLWLIPDHTYLGAAIATLATEALVATLLLIRVSRLEGMSRFGLLGLERVLVACCVSAAVGAAGLWLGLPWPVGILTSTVAFVGAAAALGYPKMMREFLAA